MSYSGITGTSLNGGTNAVPLNPTSMQNQANSALTQQQQQQAQNLATLLQHRGQNQKDQRFTSPWQVASQWANALAGKMKQGQVNQQSAAANQMTTPGGGNAPVTSNPSMPAVPAGSPAPGSAPPPLPATTLPYSGTGMGDFPVDPSMMTG